MDDKPTYLIVSELIKHFRNRNYGLAETILLDLWYRLAYEHHEQEKEQKKEPE